MVIIPRRCDRPLGAKSKALILNGLDFRPILIINLPRMLHKCLVLVILLLGAAATFPHVLQKIEQQLRHAESAYTSGEHSQAFSRLMAVKLQLDELHAEMGMEGHRVQPTTENCSTLLQQLVTHTISPNWL